MTTTTVSSKGQIVLPKRLLDELKIREVDELEIVYEAGRIVLVPRKARGRRPGWRGWRGSVAGSPALDDHLREHAEEVAGERYFDACELALLAAGRATGRGFDPGSPK